jgi:hypothetical protein
MSPIRFCAYQYANRPLSELDDRAYPFRSP